MYTVERDDGSYVVDLRDNVLGIRKVYQEDNLKILLICRYITEGRLDPDLRNPVAIIIKVTR